MTDLPEFRESGAAPSQHSAPAMPSQAPVTSPHRQLPGAGTGPTQPQDTDVGTECHGNEAKENEVQNFGRSVLSCYHIDVHELDKACVHYLE